MQTIILDDHGRAWDARSPALRSFLHCSLPDFDFLTYLVENLGFVAVTKIAPNAARIRFRPETASQTSIAAALYCLADMGIERTVISHPDQFAEKLIPSLAQTIAYIAEQIGCEPSATFFAHSRAQSCRSKCLRTRTKHFHHFSRIGLIPSRFTIQRSWPTCCPNSLRGRFMLVEPVDGRLTITDVGPGFEIFGETWRKNARGLPMEEQPDYNYGQWVQGIYRRVQETLVPRLDEVNATIRRPDTNDSIHCHYQRLILPFTCKGNGGTCLLGASVV